MTRFQTEPIELREGWSGVVLTGCDLRWAALLRAGLPRREDWRDFLNRLAAEAEGIPGYQPLKVSRSVEVTRGRLAFGDDAIEVVCKRARSAARGRGLRGWRVSRERRNFDRAIALLGRGLDTALPLACIERRGPRRAAWLVTQFIPDLLDLDQAVLMRLPRIEPRRIRRIKDGVVSAVVRLCIQLEQSGLFYRDMKASNIMLADWTDQGGPLRTVLVDLDGLRRRRFWEGRRQWRSLVRLAASLADAHAVTRSDFGRFLKAYLQQTGEPPASWKRRYSTLGSGVEDYVRRARRRKQHKFDGYSGG